MIITTDQKDILVLMKATIAELEGTCLLMQEEVIPSNRLFHTPRRDGVVDSQKIRAMFAKPISDLKQLKDLEKQIQQAQKIDCQASFDRLLAKLDALLPNPCSEVPSP